jgi:hypothetical protein
MHANRGFWQAFWAGLASPASLYAEPAPYMAYVRGHSVARAFATVGTHLKQASGQILHVAPPKKDRNRVSA